MTANADCFVSVVVPLSDDGAIVGGFVDDTIRVLKNTYSNYELVLVDDGSVDNTRSVLEEALATHECVRVLRLSRRFGEEIAIFAGLDTVIGDFVVVMIPNWDPPALIPDIVAKARDGAEIVFGVSSATRGDNPVIRLGASAFDWYCRSVLKLSLPDRSTQFRVLSRQAVNAVIEAKNVRRYLRVLSADVGFSRDTFVYKPVNRGGHSKRRGIRESLSLAAGIMVSASAHPLRVASWLGVLASTINLIYVAYIVVIYLVKEDIARGWTTLSMQTAGMFFFVFLILTVMSEYLGHILVETMKRPLYHVLEEKTSATSVTDAGRRNIVAESRAQQRRNAS